MILERSMSDGFLTNTYLVADEPGGSAVLVDAGGPMAPLFEVLQREDLTLTAVLLTHHHYDHVCALDEVLERFPGTPVLIHALERELVPQATGEIVPGEPIPCGALRIEPLHTPGHTAGMVSLLVSDGAERATPTRPPSATSSSATRSCASGAGSIRRALSRARRSASRRR
jgi:hydroxyacylglutathione hydrolase